MKRVLLTGGSGFVGRNLAESCLASRYELVVPTHGELDLCDEEQVRSYLRGRRVDAVVHTAIKPSHRNAPDPSRILFINTRMFFALARNSDCFSRMLVTGSGAVYDARHYVPRMREDYFDVHMPGDELGFSKYITMKAIERARVPMVDLRLFGVFGKREDYAIRFISNAICKTLFDLPITLRQNRRFSYLYVNDLAPIVELFLEHDVPASAYNVAPPESVELLELAKMVKRIARSDVPIVVASEEMGPEYTADSSSLMAVFPHIAFTPLEQAIGELYGWYAERRNLIRRDLLLVDR